MVDANLQQEFQALLDTHGFPESKKKDLLQIPEVDKRALVLQSKKCKSPRETIETAPSEPLTLSLSRVPPSPTDNAPEVDHQVPFVSNLNEDSPVNWMVNFHQIGGLAGIEKILGEVHNKEKKSKQDQSTELECARCVCAFITSPRGLEMLLQSQKVVNLLVLSLDASLLKTKMIILEILSLITELPNGHTNVITALENYKEVKKEPHLGSVLVQSLKDEENIDYLIACVRFINSLVTSPCMDVKEQSAIQKEFLNAGIVDVFKKLRHKNSEELEDEMVVFLEEMQE